MCKYNIDSESAEAEAGVPVSGDANGGRVLEPQMSMATKRYAGKKGFLDDDDKIIRQYDKDGDGVFTLGKYCFILSHLVFLYSISFVFVTNMN